MDIKEYMEIFIFQTTVLGIIIYNIIMATNFYQIWLSSNQPKDKSVNIL